MTETARQQCGGMQERVTKKRDICVRIHMSVYKE